MEGLCNQLMAIFRTIGEALFYASQNQAVGILLDDVQTRNSIDLNIQPYFSKINIDSYVAVNDLIKLLANKNISVKRSSEENNEIPNNIITCKRFPQRQMLPNESRDTGVFIAKHFPFAVTALQLANCIIGSMSFYPRWKALQLRIEGDLMHFYAVYDAGLEPLVKDQLQQIIDIISTTPNPTAIYIASGIQDEKYHDIVNLINEKFPRLTITRKKDILNAYPDMKEKFESLCLEQQALIDWLVCLGAPFFAGPHASSFAYLAGYMRHYREFDKESTLLYPGCQPYWDEWFPRV